MNNMRMEEYRIQVSEEDWVTQMEEEFKELEQNPSEESKRWSAMSIYRIPLSLKNLSKEAYQPQMVAIGPYHHQDEHLKDMEEHKKRALRKFLCRSKKSLHDYVNALTPMLQDLKNAYQQLQPELQSGDFLKMMVLDGCFLLELLRTQDQSDQDQDQDQTSTDQGQTSTKEKLCISDYQCNDPVFSKHGHIYFGPHLKRDMLMLENQIPLRVLIKLVEVEGLWKENVLTKILKFFNRCNEINSNGKFKNCLHILDLYRRSLLSLEKKESTTTSGGCKETVWKMLNRGCGSKNKKDKQYNMRSATELAEAGIRFEKVESTYVDQVSFNGGTLMLPLIKVDDATKTMYLNMMAFERFHVNRWTDKNEGNHVTSYVFFMDRLIDTAKDVSLLHKRHIMEISVGSDQVVAEMFNALSTDICLDSEDQLRKVQKRVAEYYRMPVPGCMAYAQRTYFINPWVSLSIVAAIFLFALTITQTVYAVLDYHKPDKPKVKLL